MKKNVIIPIFIPHLGCDNDCVFCNQKLITAKTSSLTPLQVEEHINKYLSYYEGKNFIVEVGFFGGSFTGIPYKDQLAYLSVAKKFKDKHLINGIRLSTRPDYIDKDVLNYLKDLSVDTIELGIQSFDDNVLLSSKRGHTRGDSLKACQLIKDYKFNLGIQLMIGLPMDTINTSIKSAKLAAKFAPEYARIYPTLILENTELANSYRCGQFVPFSFNDMVFTAKEMYKILEEAGSYIMRVGLKSTSIITTNSDMSGSYHPAFRQIVEGQIAKEKIEMLFLNLPNKNQSVVDVRASQKSFNSIIGHKGENKKYFSSKYPSTKFIFNIDINLKDGVYSVKSPS